MNYFPDRKVLAGGIGGVGAWLIMLGASHFGLTIPTDIQAQLAGAIGWGIAYAVPPAEQDIVKHVNDDIVRMAGKADVPVTK